jgi:hypothetical protein
MQNNNPYINDPNRNSTNSYPQAYPNLNTNPSSQSGYQQNPYYNAPPASSNNLVGQDQGNTAYMGGNQQTYAAKYENNNYGYNVKQEPQSKSKCC